ncbi:MAG TPA: 50S ribosomal protein L9 [bacterium]|nr:50S ribosomal protein L9 [bacterium]
MRIILTQNVPNLGSLGDEVAVKDGYARNFLLPRGMAMPASGENAKAIQHRRAYLEKQRAEAIAEATGEADKVSAMEIVVRARSGTGGRLFGSITNRDLQAAFAEQGLELDRKAIILKTPVKTLGTFGATVRLHTDVKVDVDFRVESSEIVQAETTEEGAGAETAPEGEAAAVAGEASGDVSAPAPEGEPAGEKPAEA